MSTKNEEQSAPIATFPAVTKGAVQETLQALATKLGLKNTVGAEDYGLLVFASQAKFGAHAAKDKAEFMQISMQVWAFIPKNPSAMRQFLFERPEEKTKPADARMSALLED